MGMSWGARDGIRVTHVPTGISVNVWCDSLARRRSVYDVKLFWIAKAWLKAKVWAAKNPSPERHVRSYHLAPDFFVSIRQGGVALAKGTEVYEVLNGNGLDGVMAKARSLPPGGGSFCGTFAHAADRTVTGSRSTARDQTVAGSGVEPPI